ncbi:ATP-dependent DNA ligase Cdc17 [Vermiconidia calcicola]|uniref:ATP-dependent DNA ligase Cdc17 n=1 Tax=Vermiconidia calcicola TaxID=1690605 RepID=A0ACC3NGK4_9PEZI|nr:ATP-dependent DNA ligase Cdc17 [Vermiconidia calcicola]
MAPKQATLGKFFGNQNGTKAAPQQSKLSFSSKSQKTPKKEADEAEDEASPGAAAPSTTNGVNGNDADEDVEMEDAKPVKKEKRSATPVKKEPADATPIKKEPSSAKKRPASAAAEDENSDGDNAEEPPTKKQRGRSKKGVATKKTSGKAALKAEPIEDEASEDDDVPGKLLTQKPATQDPIEQERNEDDEVPGKAPTQRPAPQASEKPAPVEQDPSEDDDEPVAKKRKSKASPKAEPKKKLPKVVQAEQPAEDEEAAKTSASEAEDEVSDEEMEEEVEKPEVAKKAREKVQSTLKSTGKDPYPDWKAGDPVPYAALCTTFSKIELTTKRLEILAHCAQFLRQVLRLTPNDLLPTVLLMIGKLAADYAGVELGIGESLIMKAIGESTGRNLKIIKEDQQKIGDLGLVAAKSRQNQPTMFKPKPLTVRGVHEGLMKIATVEGQGAQGRKVDGIKKLLSSADTNLPKGQTVDITQDKGGPSEAKFIIRALEGKMRLGLADKNLQVAISHAMVAYAVSQDGKQVPSETELKKGEEVFKAVYNELPSYEVIVPALLKGGIWKLRETCKLQPGVPLKPMLAKPTKSIGEVLDRFEGKDFTCEYKYDGERAQIHFVAHDSDTEYAATVAPSAGKSERGTSNIFSRNSEDLSKKYPDILAKLPTWVKKGTKSFVLDCETVAWDVEKRHVLPFQQLMTRKKKDVKVEDVKVKVCVFAFDVLFLNGEALVNKSFRERRDLMYGAFEEVEGEFSFAKFGNTREVEEIQTLLDESIQASCEGLMVKMLDGVESHYEPSRRSQNWLKVKKDYLSGAGDSLDLVVLGAYYGKGKRTSVYGAFHLACYNQASEQYETVCNIGTGFSEAILAELYDALSPLAIDRAKPFYDHSTGKNDQPDVWFEPRYVWEVKTADLTLSPRYRAAASEFGGDGVHKGVSLRFPRFIRVRDDKKPEEATSSRQAVEMYRKQAEVGKDKKAAVDDDFEY